MRSLASIRSFSRMYQLACSDQGLCRCHGRCTRMRALVLTFSRESIPPPLPPCPVGIVPANDLSSTLRCLFHTLQAKSLLWRWALLRMRESPSPPLAGSNCPRPRSFLDAEAPLSHASRRITSVAEDPSAYDVLHVMPSLWLPPSHGSPM